LTSAAKFSVRRTRAALPDVLREGAGEAAGAGAAGSQHSAKRDPAWPVPKEVAAGPQDQPGRRARGPNHPSVLLDPLPAGEYHNPSPRSGPLSGRAAAYPPGRVERPTPGRRPLSFKSKSHNVLRIRCR
jgi:hypothetical protein